MSASYIRQLTAIQTILSLKTPQIAKLNALLDADDSLFKDTTRLEILRGEIGTLLLQDSVDLNKLKKLRSEIARLEQLLHVSSGQLDQKVRKILSPKQYQLMSENLFEVTSVPSHIPGGDPPVVIVDGNTWQGSWPIDKAVGSSLVQNCEAWATWTYSGDPNWRVLGGLLVPSGYKVDFSKGAQGGYTLDITVSENVTKQRIRPVFHRSQWWEAGLGYTVGFSIFIELCSEPFFGDPARFHATFTLYGIKL